MWNEFEYKNTTWQTVFKRFGIYSLVITILFVSSLNVFIFKFEKYLYSTGLAWVWDFVFSIISRAITWLYDYWRKSFFYVSSLSSTFSLGSSSNKLENIILLQLPIDTMTACYTYACWSVMCYSPTNPADNG